MSPRTSKAPTKPRPYHHGGLREELLRLGLSVLESHGASKVSLRDLATRAGVSKTAPYRHFADREALLSALMQMGWAALRTAMADATDSVNSPTDKLFAMGRAYVAFALERPGMYRLLFSGEGKSLPGSNCSESDDSFALLVGQIESCQATGWRSEVDPEMLALSYWSLVHGAADLALEGLVRPPPGVDALVFWSRIVAVLQP